MYYLILMSGKWYSQDVKDCDGIREALDNMLVHAGYGAVVSITDDLETFCDEMGIDRDAIVEVE